MLAQVLPPADMEQHFGSADPKEVAREINRLGQRELQVRALPRPGAGTRMAARIARLARLTRALCCPCRQSSEWYTGRKPSATTTIGCGGSSLKVRRPASSAPSLGR